MPKHGISLPRLAGLPVRSPVLKVNCVSPGGGSAAGKVKQAPAFGCAAEPPAQEAAGQGGEEGTLTRAFLTIRLCSLIQPSLQGELGLTPTEVRGAVSGGGSALVGPRAIRRRAKHLQKCRGSTCQPTQAVWATATRCVQGQRHHKTFPSPFRHSA